MLHYQVYFWQKELLFCWQIDEKQIPIILLHTMTERLLSLYILTFQPLFKPVTDLF